MTEECCCLGEGFLKSEERDCAEKEGLFELWLMLEGISKTEQEKQPWTRRSLKVAAILCIGPNKGSKESKTLPLPVSARTPQQARAQTLPQLMAHFTRTGGTGELRRCHLMLLTLSTAIQITSLFFFAVFIYHHNT